MCETVASGRKTFKEKLRPTPLQEQTLEEVLWRCRELYNAALEQRISPCGVSAISACSTTRPPSRERYAAAASSTRKGAIQVMASCNCSSVPVCA
jgi:hypothetical protein